MSDYQDEINRGEQARRILEDELYVEAVTAVERDCFEAWKATKWNEQDKRESIYRQLKALGEVQTRLTATLEGGKIARSLLDKLLKR